VEACIDFAALMAELGIGDMANAAQICDRGNTAEHPSDQMSLADGWAHITDAGAAVLQPPTGRPPQAPAGHAGPEAGSMTPTHDAKRDHLTLAVQPTTI